LSEHGLTADPAGLRVVEAGDGNINFVRRVQTGEGRALVVKQARETLERFPEYSVSTDRLVFEQRFGSEVAKRLGPPAASGDNPLPESLHFDDRARAVVMEDLGSTRLDRELAAGRVPLEALEHLGAFLARLADVTAGDALALQQQFGNDEMRELHGEHIFTLPFDGESEFGAPAAALEASDELVGSKVRARIAELRESYYGVQEGLVHADVQAGNLLLRADRLRLIDAEISHVGDPAFDLGTALAHLAVYRAVDPNHRAGAGETALLRGYHEAGGSEHHARKARNYAGVEVLRRVLGAARLPFLESAEPARRAVALGVEMVGA